MLSRFGETIEISSIFSHIEQTLRKLNKNSKLNAALKKQFKVTRALFMIKKNNHSIDRFLSPLDIKLFQIIQFMQYLKICFQGYQKAV